MPRGIPFALGFGIASALLYFAGQSSSVIGITLANFAMLPMVMAGLAFGTLNALLAALSGTLTLIALTNTFSGGIFLITIAIPCCFVARYALMNRRTRSGDVGWYPVGSTLAKLTAYGSVLLVLAAVVNLGVEGGFRGSVERLLSDIFHSRLRLSSQLDYAALLHQIVSYFPSILVIVWLLLLSINTILGQALLTWSRMALRPTPNYSFIKAPEWLYWALVGSGTTALLGNGSLEYISRNLAVVFAAPFFYIGLCIIHVLVRRVSLPNLALTAFYIFVITLGWPALAVAGLGFFEQWVELRKRFICPANGTK